ncbi:MAG: anti-sigma factor [Dehalococcoidia bacterium]
MNCDELDEALPGYALGALDAEEREAVEAHLAGCREHDDALAELRATGLALRMLEETPEPSAALGRRIGAIARRSAARDGPVHLALARPRRRLAPGVPWAAVAALLLVAAFGAGWFVGTAGDDVASDVSAMRYSYAMRGEDGALVRLNGVEGGDTVTVTMADIDPLPEGRRYTLWAIRDGRWERIGACNTDEDGWWAGDFDYAVQAGEEVALTVEPVEGSDRPSTPALMRARF